VGDAILNGRPIGTGYTSLPQLRSVLLASGFSTDQVRAVLEHVTIHSWTDERVANPVPLSAAVAPPAAGYYAVTYVRPSGAGGPVYRFGHDKNRDGANITAPLVFDPSLGDNSIYDHHALNPMWIEVVARSPVHVNGASRETLVALLSGLRGFFTSIEPRRRRSVTYPSSSTSNYRWLSMTMTYDSTGTYIEGGTDGDECGKIFTTLRYWNEKDGALPADGISAQMIADEIIACRLRVKCDTVHTAYGTVLPPWHDDVTEFIDYSTTATGGTLPYAGPFRSWAQFHAFVDGLVERGVIREWNATRQSLFRDYYQSGSLKPAASWIQLRMAAEAAGDVLKANFNPNLHLNEFNPDRNLYLHVDKTDLLVNSTEFSLYPTNGAYRIESLGRVLLPPQRGDDALTAPNNQIVAEKKLVAVVSLWSAIRHTTQEDFYPALTSVPVRAGTVATNNDRQLEVGPEVDNGPLTSSGNGQYIRYDGYVRLATYGGYRHNLAASPKGPNSWLVTVAPSFAYSGIPATGLANDLSSKIHAHFQFDHTAHWHQNSMISAGWQDIGVPLGRYGWAIQISWSTGSKGIFPLPAYNSALPGPSLDFGFLTNASNIPARNETLPGPYGPADYSNPSSPKPVQYYFRLARSFTLPAGGSFSFSPTYATCHDLRMDGAYIARRSSFGYFIWDKEAWRAKYNDASSLNESSFRLMEGTASFWFKPNWFPECTGKPRTLLSFARPRYHARVYRKVSGFSVTYYGNWGFDHNNTTQAGGPCPSSGTDYTQNDCDNWWNMPASTSPNPYLMGIQPFTLYYFPNSSADDENSGSPSPYEAEGSMGAAAGYTPAYQGSSSIGRFRPCSLGWGIGFSRRSGDNWDLSVFKHNPFGTVFSPGYWNYGIWERYVCDRRMDHPKWFYPSGPYQNAAASRHDGHFVAGSGTGVNFHGTWAHYHNAVLGPTLNHEDHGTGAKPHPLRGRDGGFNFLRGHEWVHLTVTWRLPPPNGGYGGTGDLEIYVNGTKLANSTAITHTYSDNFDDLGSSIRQWTDIQSGLLQAEIPWWWISPILWSWNGNIYWGAIGVYLGGECDWPIGASGPTSPYKIRNDNARNISNTAGWPLYRNFYADGTFDEFYLWTDRSAASGGGLSGAQTLWFRGRYYRPSDSSATDATLTSSAISIPQPTDTVRQYPPASAATPPTGSTVSFPAPAPVSRILGVSWTAYGEAVNAPDHPTMGQTSAEYKAAIIPYLRDWSVHPGNSGSNPPVLAVPATPDVNNFKAVSMVDVYVIAGGVTYGPFRNEHFSPVLDSAGNFVQATSMQYRIKLKTGAGRSAVLLTTPVFDDITIYYDYGGPQIGETYWEAYAP
jgi:hypothetical protein